MSDSERHADLAMLAVDAATDREYAKGEEADRKAGLKTDLSDLLANVRHLCDRYGFDYSEIDDHAYLAYSGDKTSAPIAEWRETVPVTEQADKLVPLSAEAYAVLCGLVQPADDVYTPGIFSGAWDELRRALPLEHFRAWANAHNDPDSGSHYNPEAGE